ncbi:hypothetical protein VTI74DRAFT_10233 [Chaetomium olivicolor]
MSNNDNAMARFLFAILQQKCLKDIDWNKVAHNPILAQEITNGHAARMRYSRFRAAMLGLEPQRRNRTNPNNKSRVSKKKKDDAPKPKKEEPEHSSGSGIGNIKMESVIDTATFKPERRSVSQPLPQPAQPSAPMATPAMMKTEPGLVNPFNQHIHHPAIFPASSPSIKHERLPATSSDTTSAMPEPTPFGIVPTTTSSAASTPYIDSHPRMPTMRLLTPCSDSDGLQGFLTHSSPPPPSDLHLHGQHHSHQHQTQQQQQQQHHSQRLVGAGSPPLSTATPSPYDFSQCLDNTAASPWQSQQQQHHRHSQHHHSQHHHSQRTGSIFATAGIGLGMGVSSGTGGAAFALDGSYNPFCAEHQRHHHHHHHQHHHMHEEDGLHVADALGLHPAAGGTTGMFREMDMARANGGTAEEGVGLGLGLAGVVGHAVKCEWDADADADGYHDI